MRPKYMWYIQWGLVFAADARATHWTDDVNQAHLFSDIREAERVSHVGYRIIKWKGEAK